MILTTRELLQLTTPRFADSQGTQTNTNYFANLEDGGAYFPRKHTTHKTQRNIEKVRKNNDRRFLSYAQDNPPRPIR